MSRLAALLLCARCWLPAQASYAPANPEWNRPIEPFRVVGNLYYIGASDVSAFLVTTSAGHILLDTGFRETAPILETNLKKLGLRVEDIRLILTSHGHYDHVGGVAEVKSRTQARFLANPAEAPLFSRGGNGDFALRDAYPYPPVEPDGSLRDGEPVVLGAAVLTPHFTPGHTKGCTSWTTTIREAEQTYRVVIACSLTAPGYRLVANPEYAGIVRDYEASLAKLRALPCDIFLSLHSWNFELHRKIQARAEDPNRNPFVDPEGYRRFLDKAEAALHKQVQEQTRSHLPD